MVREIRCDKCDDHKYYYVELPSISNDWLTIPKDCMVKVECEDCKDKDKS